MGWNDDEQENMKKGMSLSSKVLLATITCIILIIILLLILLLMNKKETSFKIYVDGVNTSKVTQSTLLTTIDNVTYVNIEEFSKLVGYEYHRGEYKSAVIEDDKCYVEGKIETASFYLNDNKVYKLLVNKRDEQYEEYTVENTIKSINNEMYASLEAISRAFNVVIDSTNNYLKIYNLEYLVNLYDANVKKWGYESIADQSFGNQKALLYGCLIVKKENGLYKVIDVNNTKEIVLDRYTSIEFSENTQEFFVTDSSSKKVGVVNLDGTTKIQPNYEEISLLDKNSDLYLVEQSKKYGVVKGGNVTVIFPEYDSIGISSNITNTSTNKKLILDTLIPVCKDKKWGAFDKKGKIVFEVEYDGLGFEPNSIEIDGIKESVEPIIAIERAKGVIVKKSDKYGLISLNGEELVPVAVNAIYAISDIKDEDERYFMLYNGEELNVIERLVKAGLIKETTDNDKNEKEENTINEADTENETTNTVSDTLGNNIDL